MRAYAALVFVLAVALPAWPVGMVCPLGETGCGPVITFPDADPTRATLLWWTDVPGDSVVEYGPSAALGSAGAVPPAATCPVGAPGTCHRVTLTGLSAGTRYFYRLRTAGSTVQEVAPDVSFQTLRATSDTAGDIDFVVLGDWGWSDGSCVANPGLPKCRVAAQIAALRPAPQMMIGLGDNAYQNGAQTPDWDVNAMPTYRDVWRSLPLFLVFGNHDLRDTAGDADDTRYTASAEYLTFPMPGNSPKPALYYSFDSGDVHFLVANTNFAATGGVPESDELAWMDNDLARTTRRWKFVLFHHTPYTCGTGGSGPSDLSLRRGFGPILERRGVDVVFYGHAHLYERSGFVDDFTSTGAPGADGAGTYYVMAGNGGGALRTPATLADGVNCPGVPVGLPVDARCDVCYWLARDCRDGPPGTPYCSIARYGFVRSQLVRDNVLTVQAIDDTGTIFDGLTIAKSTTSTSSTTSSTTSTIPAAGTCASPIVLPAAGGIVRGVTAGTSARRGSCTAATGSAPEVVFAWTPERSGLASIRTCGPGTSYDTVLYLLADSCAGPELACNDDAAGCSTADGCSPYNARHGSRLAPTVTGGQRYLIVVDGYGGSCGGSKGSFTLTVTPPASTSTTSSTVASTTSSSTSTTASTVASTTTSSSTSTTASTVASTTTTSSSTTTTSMPAPGTCANPLRIPDEGGSLTGATAGSSAHRATCAVDATAGAPEQVFVWTPARSGEATIATCGATTAFDTVVSMLTGDCATGREIACNDDTPGCATGDPCGNRDHHGSRIVTIVTAGQPYFIVVDGYAGSCGGSSGAYALTVSLP